ncbi:hypothetical protein AAC387_Pa01g4350 [Persea americana]
MRAPRTSRCLSSGGAEESANCPSSRGAEDQEVPKRSLCGRRRGSGVSMEQTSWARLIIKYLSFDLSLESGPLQ